MTDWEVIEKKTLGRGGGNYGNQWSEVPAVAVTKGGITVNGKFVDAFCNGSTSVLVLVAKDSRKIGLKFVPKDQFEPAAFTLSAIKSKRSKSRARHCTCKMVGKRFPDTTGFAYRAHTSADGRVIEVELSPENKCK